MRELGTGTGTRKLTCVLSDKEVRQRDMPVRNRVDSRQTVRNRLAGWRRGLGMEGDKSRYRFRGVSR